MSKPFPLLPLVAGVLAVVLAACANDSTSTTTSSTVPAPTTSASNTAPATTSAPTTTAAPTTSSTPGTTLPAEPELTEATVEEDLVRTFPVAAGWIVETTDDALTVGISVGSQECYGLASSEAEETDDEVRVTLFAGFHPDATACGDPAPNWTFSFPLEQALGDRAVIDTHTGIELGTEAPDPEE